MTSSRRSFLKTTAVTAAAGVLAGVPKGWAGGVYADDAPETPNMRFGIIALTDCASIVMAHELGYFRQFGIQSIVSKEASWAAIRDKLSLAENQATHMLIGMPYAPRWGWRGRRLNRWFYPWMINRNGQGISLSARLLQRG
jgi:nitrate/nitrite transport system substrate-binding protein